VASSSQGYHEDERVLDDALKDRHRAIVSIMEELEAIDWYDQRVAAASDTELAALLAHNRDEEKEHAAMLLEWLRRRDTVLAENLTRYLFSDRGILDIEEAAATAETGGVDRDHPASDGSLRIGSLRGTTNL